MGPQATYLPDGARLHLHHGPIDLIVFADGARDAAYRAAFARFETVLQDLVGELPVLRQPLSPLTRAPAGRVAQRMHRAAMPLRNIGYLTRMAAVAGAVADEVLAAMCAAAPLRRAFVNNGGDIALHLEHGQVFKTAMQGHAGQSLGHITLRHEDQIGGIATSGRHGRSHSLGIADSVTVLAKTAAEADVAATLIANAVDLPEHPGVQRQPAHMLTEDSDLGDLPVVTGCARLCASDCQAALSRGLARANALAVKGLIAGAAMFLQGHALATPSPCLSLTSQEPAHA